MGTTFQTFADQFEHTITITWGDRQIEARLTWRQRQGAWYMDLFQDDGTAIVYGRRLSPNSSPTSGFAFEGDTLSRGERLLIGGPSDPYLQDALGTIVETSLIPILYTAEELAEARANNASPTFETQVFLTP